MQAIWKNLTAGISNFCNHNNFDEVILGLSGGLDSAVVAVAAAEALGGKNVYALMMKTAFTSELSLQIAEQLAELNNLDYRILDIQPLIDYQKDFLQDNWNQNIKKLTLEI